MYDQFAHDVVPWCRSCVRTCSCGYLAVTKVVSWSRETALDYALGENHKDLHIDMIDSSFNDRVTMPEVSGFRNAAFIPFHLHSESLSTCST